MNDLFGLSMNYIMGGLLVVLAIAAAAVGWVLLRNRVMFFIGVRNIPRRKAQTVLVIIGLMLSTTIISAAFSIGDTVNYSITNQAYDRLHSIDEVVQAQTGQNDSAFDSGASITSPVPIPEGQAKQYVDAFQQITGVDGAVSVIRGPVPVSNERAGQTEPLVLLVGVPTDQTRGFQSDFEDLQGNLVSVADLGQDEIYANKSAADKLDVKQGDTLRLFVAGQGSNFTVKDILQDRVLTGTVFGEAKGLLLGLPRAQEVFQRPEQVDLIAVSNDGGVHNDLGKSKAIEKALNEKLQGTKWRAKASKLEAVNAASDASSQLTAFFVVLGLFSIAAGMLLIFLIFVMLAAERKVEMGMVRAVGTKRRHLIQMFMSEGMAYNVMAAAVGCALGIAISLVMVRVMAALFSAFDLSIVFHVTARSLIVSYSLGVVLTFVTVTFSSWRISSLNIVAAIRDISESVTKRAGLWSLTFGGLGVAFGLLLLVTGWQAALQFPFTSGFTLAILGLALIARFIGVRPRAVFTTAGLVLLLFWLLGAGNNLPFIKKMDGGMEMFFLSGIAMVASCTWVLVYNADLMLAGLTLTGGRFSRLLPSIRTAVAYPLANKFRTGMTIAMISLVVFALVMMSTMQTNFSRIFLSDDALGGYQVRVTENPSNHITDLRAALTAAGFNGPGGGTSGIDRVDDVDVASQRVVQVRMAPAPGEKGDDFSGYPTYGATDSFIANNGVKFQARAEGLATDADVWRKMASDPNTAVIDAFSIPGGGFNIGGPGFSLKGIKQTDRTFQPLKIEVRDAASGKTREVQIVGIISFKASAMYFGLYLAPGVFSDVFPKPDSTLHFVRLNSGVSSTEMAKGIEKALLAQGVQADSLRKLIDDNQALNQGFLYLIQGFMGLGLFVGIAAVGVIAFRTVVERRQQIGMLRALGYTRRAVALSFVMESSFITLLGVVSGVALGLLLARQLITSEDFSMVGIEGFYIPWLQVLGIGAFAFLASLLMTIVPSRQASSIPIAQALRYE